jgi:L-gulonolactone oxidase
VRRRVTNWAGNASSSPARRHEPRTEDELAAILARASRAGERVRARGGGHSWNDGACTDGHLVSLARMDRILAVDAASRRVTVEAGIRIRDLSERLAERGLALANVGSIQEQSLAGAIATGTHGSGARLGILSTQVAALRLVTPAGGVLELSEERDPETFSAARVGLGALGIVSAVTLACVPAFDLAEELRPVSFAEALARMEEWALRNDHAKLWWLPHTDVVAVFLQNRTSAPRTPRGLARRFEESPLQRALFAALLRVGAARPRLVPALSGLVARTHFRARRRVDRSDRVLALPMPPVHRETEYAIPRARAAEALARLRALVEERRLTVNFIVEVRFVAADEIMLSPAAGRESCYLGAYLFTREEPCAYFAAFERLMEEFEGRPHWGKSFDVAPARLAALYPKLARFGEIRAALDPGRTLENAYLARIFGPR